MADQFLLSDLCSVCHAQVPKYRCPRCSSKTCSLPCVQLHKARGPCDGVRDPTGYVKKANLATSSGIDHDFNFIRGLERGIENAEKLIDERGLNREERFQKHAGPLRARMRDVGVRVEKAPVGMQRERMNKTHWAPKARHILWTVEWIEEDGSRHLDEFGEHVTLEQAHIWLLRRLKGKRKPGTDNNNLQRGGRRGRKAKEAAANQRSQAEVAKDASNVLEIQGEHVEELEPFDSKLGEATASEALTQGVEEPDETLAVKPVESQTTQVAGAAAQEGTDNNIAGEAGGAIEVGDSQVSNVLQGEKALPEVEATPPEKETRLPSYFYLVKPRSGNSAGQRVLIHLPGDATMATSLRGQVVLEFPTVQVLSQPPDQLPVGFVTEEQFKALITAEEEALQKEIQEAGLAEDFISLDVESHNGKGGRKERLPNQSDLLAILNRDIAG